MKIEATEDGLVLYEVYSGVGIRTPTGLFGIAQRDDGIEVMLEGKTVWTSRELPETGIRDLRLIAKIQEILFPGALVPPTDEVLLEEIQATVEHSRVNGG